MQNNLDLSRLWEPPEQISVSEWSDRYRILSGKHASFKGRWRTAAAEYQRTPMDCFSDTVTKEIVLCWAAQCGKSDVALNCLGRAICVDPGPVLYLLENDEQAKNFKQSRFDPMVEESPALGGLVSSKKRKDGQNSEDHAGFPGGGVSFRGTQKTAKVKSDPIRYLFCDEVDDWKLEIGTKDNEQGDPLDLADVRTSNFPHNRKTVITSTPTTETRSRVWRRFQNGSQEYYHLQCPGCQHPQVLDWDRFNPETAEFKCSACQQCFRQTDWHSMLAKGNWQARFPERRQIRSFWLNCLYSPFLVWSEIAAKQKEVEELAETGDEARLKTFTNTRQALLWHDKGGNLIKHAELYANGVVYPHPVPDDVVMITAGIDYQSGDRRTGENARLKYSLYGWAAERTGFLIEAGTIWGGADDEKALKQVDELIFERTFEKSDKTRLEVARAFFDSGNLPDPVYQYCSRKAPRMFPIKGVSRDGYSIWKPSKINNGTAPLILVGVDTCKSVLQGKLSKEPLSPGSINFPKASDDSDSCGADEHFFREITAEYRKSVFKNGYHSFVWEKKRSQDNDFGDCLVYAFAAMEFAGGRPALEKLASGEKRPVIQIRKGALPARGLEMHPDFRPPQEASKPAPTAPTQPPGPLQPHLKPGFRRVGRFKIPNL